MIIRLRVACFPQFYSIATLALLTLFHIESNLAHTPMALDYSLAVGMCEQYQEYLTTHKFQPPLKHKSKYAASRRCGWMHKQTCARERYCSPYVFKPCEEKDSYYGQEKQDSSLGVIKLAKHEKESLRINKASQESDSKEYISFEKSNSPSWLSYSRRHDSHELSHSTYTSPVTPVYMDEAEEHHNHVEAGHVGTSQVEQRVAKPAENIKDVLFEMGAYGNTIQEDTHPASYHLSMHRDKVEATSSKFLHQKLEIPKQSRKEEEDASDAKSLHDPLHDMKEHFKQEASTFDHSINIPKNSITSDSSESHEHSKVSENSKLQVTRLPHTEIRKDQSSEEISTTTPVTSQSQSETPSSETYKNLPTTTQSPFITQLSSQKESGKRSKLIPGKSSSSKLKCCSCECGSSASFEDDPKTGPLKGPFPPSTARSTGKASESILYGESNQPTKSIKTKSKNKCKNKIQRKGDTNKTALDNLSKLSHLQDSSENSIIPASTISSTYAPGPTTIPHITFHPKKAHKAMDHQVQQSPRILMYISESLSKAMCKQLTKFHKTGKIQQPLDEPSNFGNDIDQDSEGCGWYQRNTCETSQKLCQLWKKIPCNQTEPPPL